MINETILSTWFVPLKGVQALGHRASTLLTSVYAVEPMSSTEVVFDQESNEQVLKISE